MSDKGDTAKIYVLSSVAEESDSEGFLPSLRGERETLKRTEVELDHIKGNIEKLASQLAGIGKHIAVEESGMSISEISFTLSLDAKGEVSLLGLTSGSIGVGGTVRLVLKRNN